MNIEFPYSYYMDEVRDGFFIPSMMKRVWAVCQDSYAYLQKELESEDIKCSAAFGNLIGAVRDGGFIPWDDDLDIDIFHLAYEQLKEKSDNGELCEDFNITDYVTDCSDNEVRKFHRNKTRIIEQNKWMDNHGYPFDNNIDLFILDYVPQNGQERDDYIKSIKLLAYIKTMYQMRDEKIQGLSVDESVMVDEYTLNERKKQAKSLTGLSEEKYSDKPEFMRYLLMSEEYCKRFTSDTSDAVTCVPYSVKYDNCIFPKEYYEKQVDMKFETGSIRVPAGYDMLLRIFYGNFMKPVYIYSGHDYPVYEEYEKDLKEIFDVELFKYHIDIDALEKDLSDRPQKKAGEKMNITILSHSVSAWESLHSIWKELDSRDDVEVTVIPVPYFYRNFDTSVIGDQMQLETEGYPAEVNLTSFDEFDVGSWHPDAVIFTSPYDEYNDAYVIHQFFHTNNLIKYTDDLIFIPPFKLREITSDDERARKVLKRYLHTPGLIYADRIYVQSEQMKAVYEELLDGYIADELGENKISELDDRMRKHLDFSGKICGIGSAIDDLIFEKEQKEKKEILIGYTGSRMFTRHEMAERALKTVDFLKKYTDEYVVSILKDRYAESILKDDYPELWDKYLKIIEAVKSIGGNVYEPDEEDIAVDNAICFYGNGCTAMNKCRMLRKPVLMEEVALEPEMTDGYIPKTWTMDLTVEDETIWCLENFINEAVRLSKGNEIQGEVVGKKIVEDIIESIDRIDRMDCTEKYTAGQDKKKLRIMLYEWKSYMRQDTESAFKQMGIEYDKFFYEDYESLDKENPEFEKQFLEAIEKSGYDAVFSINYRTVIAKCAYKIGIPYISWVYDCPFGIGEDEETLKLPTNRIFVFDRRTVEQLQARGVENVYHQPLAVDVDRIDTIGINPDDRESYGADISFVGKLYPSTFAGFYNRLGEYEKGQVDAVLEAQSKMYGAYLLDVMTEGLMCERISEILEGKAEYDRLFHESLQSIICKEITRRERLSLLFILSQDFNVALYSDKPEPRLDRVSQRGIISGYDENYKVYRSSNINLNISFKRIAEGIPLRALDIMAAGGFLLSNYQPELVENFESGVECVVYDSLEDAYAKAVYYLQHEDERREIAKRGKEKARQFAYEIQLKKIFDTVFA